MIVLIGRRSEADVCNVSPGAGSAVGPRLPGKLEEVIHVSLAPSE